MFPPHNLTCVQDPIGAGEESPVRFEPPAAVTGAEEPAKSKSCLQKTWQQG